MVDQGSTRLDGGFSVGAESVFGGQLAVMKSGNGGMDNPPTENLPRFRAFEEASQRASHTSEACQQVVHLTTVVDLQGDRRPKEIHAEELTKLPCDARDSIRCAEG